MKTWLSFLLSIALSAAALQGQIYHWTTIAGNAGWGFADGTNSDGHFSAPVGIAADQNGNLFVADYRANTIRKITPVGTNWVVSTLAGSPGVQGGADGTNDSAQFYSPVGIAVDSPGNLYVGDCYNYVVRKLTRDGTNWAVTTIAGKTRTSGNVDGTNSAARFSFVYGVAVDANGNVYVADGNNSIRKITPMGTNWVVTTIAKLGVYPDGLTIDPQGNLYETDRSHTVLKISPVGTNWVVSVLAGAAYSSGSGDGTNGNARFMYPAGLWADGQGHVLVADSNNHTLRYLTQDGTNWIVTTIGGLAGTFGDVNGTNTATRFYYPKDIAVGTDGTFYITDDLNYCIRSLRLDGTNWIVGTIAGSGGPGSADGTNNQARFNQPWAVTIGNGDLYVADKNNNVVRKLTRDGTNWVVSSIAGKAGSPGFVNGTNSIARFSSPEGIAADAGGNLYVADAVNGSIRKISPQDTNWVVSTVSSGFSNPGGVAVDSFTNIYVSDTGNHRICQLSPNGANWALTTLAGRSGYSGYLDGTNGDARFDWPRGIALDGAGNLFVGEDINKVVRKITPMGTNWVVTTIAGTYGYLGGDDGTNGDAHFDGPYGFSVNRAGAIFVTDYLNDTIRKITPVGTNWVVTTLGGKAAVIGQSDFIGTADGTNSEARFNLPTGIAVDANDHIFVTDSSNNTIREGFPFLVSFGNVSQQNGAFTMTWPAYLGQVFQLQSTTDLLGGWNNFGNPITAQDLSVTATDTVTNKQRFYRVQVIQ